MNLRGKRLVYGDEVARWVWNQLGIDPIAEYAAIGLAGDTIVAGSVFTRYIKGASIELTVASEGRMWGVPDYGRAVFAYPFKQLDCQRVTAVIASRNSKSRALCEHMGFVQEGFCPHWFKDDDSVIYGMYRNNCRWIATSRPEG